MSLREQMQSIYDKHGRLEPAIVVEEAKNKDHPLHNRFEWDDSVAAHRYRLEQAHELITSIKITFRKAEDAENRSVRAFHAVRDGRGFAYEPTEKVIQSPVMREVVLADMEREWRQLYQRYNTFVEFAAMVQKDLEKVAV